MTKNHWFAEQVKSGVGEGAHATVHLLRGDGTIETVDARAVVIERDGHGIVMSTVEPAWESIRALWAGPSN